MTPLPITNWWEFIVAALLAAGWGIREYAQWRAKKSSKALTQDMVRTDGNLVTESAVRVIVWEHERNCARALEVRNDMQSMKAEILGELRQLRTSLDALWANAASGHR